MERRHVWVSGRVQGVWFRQSCAEAARAADTAGWVRNLRDGRVEALFEGSGPAVEAMVAWCRQGPPRASVREIVVTTEDPEGLTSFRVGGGG